MTTTGLSRKAVLFHKASALFTLLYSLPLTVLAMPLALLVRVLKPKILIRFGAMRSERIGHFTTEVELYLCERDSSIAIQKSFDIFYCASKVCNEQLKCMWARKLKIWQFVRWIDKANRLLPGGGQHVIKMPMILDSTGLLAGTRAHLSFLPEEERVGKEALRKMGVPEGSPFICFFSRDLTYLKSEFPHMDFKYHGFRNSDINSYLSAAEELAGKGYYLIRMGSIVKQAVTTTNPRIIDYARLHRTDFMDIYLGAKCAFFMGDDSGMNAVSKIFRKPVIYVNLVPVSPAVLFCCAPNSIFIPKKIWSKQEQRFLTFRQIEETGVNRFGMSEQFDRLGLECVNNTPDEIAAVAREMEGRTRGTWRTADLDLEIQERFRDVLKLKGFFEKTEVRIGADFIRQNIELLN